jgi:Tol biopolymer transport system component
VKGVADLYVLPPGGGEPIRLTRDRYDDAHPTWSADGRRIAFVSDRQDSRNIWMLDVGAMSETARTPVSRFASGAPFHFYQLTRRGRLLYDDRDPAWCPRADVIAFSSDRRDSDSEERVKTGRRGIFRVSTGPRPVLSRASTLRGIYEQPAWTPDGKNLVCVLTPPDGARTSEEPMLWLIEGVQSGKKRSTR